jgi:phosphoribosyl-ATP pyrophosphohydrolase
MSDSLGRLYQAVIAAKDLDPATSRTARLFQRGPAKMAKKLAEEAIEVVIDAVNGKTDAVVRESADLLYNLTVLWAAAGVKPEDVWREMARRELMLGIAEKLPKSTVKPPKAVSNKAIPDKAVPTKSIPDESLPDKAISAKALPKAATSPAVRRRIVALEGRSLRKRH